MKEWSCQGDDKTPADIDWLDANATPGFRLKPQVGTVITPSSFGISGVP